MHFPLSPANCHDAPFARPLLQLAVRLSHIRPRIIRLDAAYWGLQLIHWIHATLGASAVVPWNPKRQKNRSCLPPTWTKEELGKRSSIERFFGRVFLFFCLQRPPYSGWSSIVRQVALAYTSSIVVGLAAWHAHRPDLIRSPKRVLAHLWEDSEFLPSVINKLLPSILDNKRYIVYASNNDNDISHCMIEVKMKGEKKHESRYSSRLCELVLCRYVGWHRVRDPLRFA
ncbi:MAG: transposase [Ktedonobacteraceae bacterium]